MARTQTIVQLTDELVAALDGEAARTGTSRSALIREAVEEWLAAHSEAAKVARYVEGYRAIPQGTPDEWGDLEAATEAAGRELARSLDAEEEAQGLEW
ncbi:MAG: ribbon-helix-helix domain-containing protein [Actinomycetota bacterium]|nr:ribbon-helix-helix domain-containing protein [Actinomycetota bacterium]